MSAPVPTPTPADTIATLQDKVAALQSALDDAQQDSYHYRAVLDALPGMAYQFVLHPDGSVAFTYVSAGIRDLYGLAPEVVYGNAFVLVEALTAEGRQQLERSFQESLAQLTLWVWEGQIRRADGALIWVQNHARPSRRPDGSVVWDGLQTNIAERKAAEAARQAEAERMQRLIASVPGMVYQFALAPDGSPSFPYVSDGSRELYEIEPADAQRNATFLLDAALPAYQPSLQASIVASAQELSPWQWEGAITTASGREKWIQAAARPVRLADGTTLWDGLLLDRTAQRVAEQEQLALQAQVIAAQQSTLAELSTPLIPISDQLLVMPIIGGVDSRRAQDVLETLLRGLEQTSARTAILDITGMSVVDTQVANTLVRAAQAARLLGAQVVLTGIQPEVAQTMITLGVDLQGLRTYATLQRAVAAFLGANAT